MEKRKMLTAASAIFAFICVAVFVVSAAVSANLNKGLVEKGSARALAVEVQPALTPEVQTEAFTYLVREWDGKICVYYNNQWESPVMVTDIDAESLRQTDRELFREGVCVADQEALLQLLEDFTS